MSKIISAIVLLNVFWISPQAMGEAVQLQDNPPARHTVVKGDTLWGISARFLKNPWKWPEVWGINQDEIKNPHLIYPGDVIILDLSGKTPRLRLEGEADGGLSRWQGNELQVSKLEPQIRAQKITAMPIPTIPAKEIEPFLSRPLAVDPVSGSTAPQIIATTDKRVIVSTGDTVYTSTLDEMKGRRWQVYRHGRVFQDPDTQEILGHEAIYLGDVDVTSFNDIATAHVVRAHQEMGMGDRLAVAPPNRTTPYVPRAPEKSIHGRIIAGNDSTVSELGPYSVVILNRGIKDGLEVGHVLGMFRSEGQVAMGGKAVPLPEQQFGTLLVFRVFNRMSYGLIVNAKRPAHILDIIKNP